MPGTPPTSPHYAIPRYSQTDSATFAAQVNAVIDQIDAAIAGIPVGGQIAWSGTGDPTDTRFLLAEGRLISSASYPAFDAIAGGAATGAAKHKYNGGVDPGGGQVRIPDKRGRVIVGPDDMGTARGAANRLTGSVAKVAGQGGGEDKHRLTGDESGVPVHPHGASTNTTGSHSHGTASTNWATPATSGSGSLAAPSGWGPVGSVSFQRLDPWLQIVTDTQGAHSHTVTVADAVAALAATSHNNLQPYEVDNVIVRVA